MRWDNTNLVDDNFGEIVVVVSPSVPVIVCVVSVPLADEVALGAVAVLPCLLLHALLDHQRLAQQQHRYGEQG